MAGRRPRVDLVAAFQLAPEHAADVAGARVGGVRGRGGGRARAVRRAAGDAVGHGGVHHARHGAGRGAGAGGGGVRQPGSRVAAVGARASVRGRRGR